MTNPLARTVKQIAVSHDANTVLVELICTDEYGALVLYDDVLSRLQTDGGCSLHVRVGATVDDEVSS
jgi:hypothetical protein